MTTVEKLLVQIFERKNSIIEQVKQQTELYSQHLASKLLIDGITPPSWLWNPNTSSESNELNKEHLISKLLRQPSARCSVAHYSVYDNLVVRGDNEEYSDGVFMENLGVNRQDHPAVPPLTSEDRAGCTINCVPELDFSVTSPEDQTDERIVDIYNAPDQSLAGIQRSKSRQKALQLRNSATALAKSGLSNDNIRNVFSSQIRFSLSATNQADQNDDLLKLAEPCVTGSQSCADWDDKANSRRKEQEKDAYSGRITRSRNYAEVPDFVRGSLTLGCSSGNCKDNASHISEVRRTKSMHISGSEQTDNYVNKWPKSVGPPTVCYQSWRDMKVDDANFRSSDNGTNDFTGRICRSSISSKCQSCGRGSSKADICSDNYQRPDAIMMDPRDDLPTESVYGSPLTPSNVLNEGCDTGESISGDCQSHRASGTVPSCSYKQQNACVDEVSYIGICSHSAKANGAVLAPFSGKSAQEVNGSKEVHGFVKPSVELFHRVTRSQTRSDDKESYEPEAYNENSSFKGTMPTKQKAAANCEDLNTSSSQFGPSCYETHDVSDEHENASLSMSNKLALRDHVDQSGSNSSTDAKQRREFEFEVAPTASDSFVFVEQKKLKFSGCEECNLKAFTLNSGKLRLDNSPEKMRCIFLDPAVSLDKEISVGINQLSLGKQSSGMSEGEAVRRELFESDIQENPNNQAEKFGPVIIATVLNNSENTTEARLSHKLSEVFCKADSFSSKMVDMPDVQIHPTKFYLEDGLESLPKRNVEEGDWSGDRKDKSQFLSSAPGRESLRSPKAKSRVVSSAPGIQNLRASHAYTSAKEASAESCDSLIGNVDMLNRICGVLDKMEQLPAQQSQICSCLEGVVCSQHRNLPLRNNAVVTCVAVCSHGESSSPGRRFRHASTESWPQLKRRKIEHRKTHCLTISPSYRVRKSHSTQGCPASTYLDNKKINTDIAVDTIHVDKYTDIETPPEMISNLVEGIESAFSCQNEEVGFCYKEKNEHKNSSSIINNEQLGTALILSLKKESLNSQGSFSEEISDTNLSTNHIDARELGDEQRSEHLCNLERDTDDLRSVDMTLTNTVLEGIQSPKWESGLQAQHSVLSPRTEDLELIDVDESMPVLEGFIVDAQEDSGELGFAADEIDFEKLNLPSNTIERASILAEICRSASLDKTLSHFSSASEFQGNRKHYQSVPSGHLEHLDFASSLPLNSDVEEQLQSGWSSVDGSRDALEGMPFFDCLDYSGAHHGWNLRSQRASPVGKLWERLPSHTGSSEKRLSSNPELTCFPIEEDASISEENKIGDENAGDVQEEVDSSLAKHCDKRQSLKDLSNLGLNLPVSVSAHEKTLTTVVDFAGTKLSVTGTQEKVQSPKKRYRNKSESSEKQTSPIGATDGRKNQNSLQGAKGIKEAKESINDSINKSLLSFKTGLKRQDQKLPLKVSRRNNIVSNVSSFIPLIQQKQAAPVCAGKRDIKVKALEAAESAKRLEEKKENERKMRKEALKLERAKLEKKNIRQSELEKKKKEEERKKKDADIITKKRQREVEEKKEKGKKKMRLEARYQQREQEKMRAGKVEKGWFKDEQMNSKKDFLDESKKHREDVRRDDIALKKADTKLTTTKVVMNYEECGTSGQSCEVGKDMHTVEKSPKNEDLIVRNSRGKSYEISPYQCSDDEDEKDDELHIKKYMPSWVSKSSVALLLPLQQEMDPDSIFPAESFCTKEEVLLPRKLQQKQVAA